MPSTVAVWALLSNSLYKPQTYTARCKPVGLGKEEESLPRGHLATRGQKEEMDSKAHLRASQPFPLLRKTIYHFPLEVMTHWKEFILHHNPVHIHTGMCYNISMNRTSPYSM